MEGCGPAAGKTLSSSAAQNPLAAGHRLFGSPCARWRTGCPSYRCRGVLPVSGTAPELGAPNPVHFGLDLACYSARISAKSPMFQYPAMPRLASQVTSRVTGSMYPFCICSQVTSAAPFTSTGSNPSEATNR